MIIFTTRGWSLLRPEGRELAWALFEHTSGSEQFTVSQDTNNAGDVALALRTWLLHPSRPWNADLTSCVIGVEDDGDGRMYFTFTLDTTISIVDYSDEWVDRIGIDMGDGNDNIGATRGSCSAMPGTVMWERWDDEGGLRSRAGSWRNGHPTLSHRRPSCELALDLLQAHALNECIALAVDPRTAYVWDEGALDDLRFVTVGKLDLQPHKADDYTKVVGTIEILGGL